MLLLRLTFERFINRNENVKRGEVIVRHKKSNNTNIRHLHFLSTLTKCNRATAASWLVDCCTYNAKKNGS